MQHASAARPSWDPVQSTFLKLRSKYFAPTTGFVRPWPMLGYTMRTAHRDLLLLALERVLVPFLLRTHERAACTAKRTSWSRK